MSKHQIIYTSCMRGINGVNDGQQVFSYDSNFKDQNNDEIKSLFSYQPPALEPGTAMTEAIAASMPQAFEYRKLSNGGCAIALKTYLGRDYMGSAGRFGNHLSHVIVLRDEAPDFYPCEAFGSVSLRDHMEYEEVNNPNPPEFLPPATLEKGCSVDIDTVTEFLGCEDRLPIYKNMVYAMLAFESQRKRIVICDSRENIIQWIAALEYMLPLKNALNINFSTYVYDPALSSSRICGVEPSGTRFQPDSARQHFSFDLLNRRCPEFEKDEDFFDFIDTAMSFSYESLQDFHRFLNEGYCYDRADEVLYAAYYLYSLLSDGVLSISDTNRLQVAFAFANEYASTEENTRVVNILLAQKSELLTSDRENFLCVSRFLQASHENLTPLMIAEIKSIFVERVLSEFTQSKCAENDFYAFYRDIEEISKRCGFSIATELMEEDNQKKLFAAMGRDIDDWTITFVVHVVSSFVKDERLPPEDLRSGARIGQIYSGIIKAVYAGKRQRCAFLVTKILDEFTFDCDYLVNKAINLEEMLRDVTGSEPEVSSMWEHFVRKMLETQRDQLGAAYRILAKYKQYDQVYALYSQALQTSDSAQQANELFEEQVSVLLSKDRDYSNAYTKSVLQDYYSAIRSNYGESRFVYLTQLFTYASGNLIDAPFMEELIEKLLWRIPYSGPKSEDYSIILNAFHYVSNVQHKPVRGKLLLLIIGLFLQETKTKPEFPDTLKRLTSLTTAEKGNLNALSAQELEDYFEWILPKVCELCRRAEEFSAIISLFNMSYSVLALFLSICTKKLIKFCKNEKDYSVFCEFLKLVFERYTEDNRDAVGKALCKHSKQTLSDLNFRVIREFGGDRQAICRWNEIRGVAESTNPILNNITNLFKRNKS